MLKQDCKILQQFIAVTNGLYGVTKIISESDRINEINVTHLRCAFINASIEGHENIIRFLSLESSVKDKIDYGYMYIAFNEAASNGKIEIMSFLLLESGKGHFIKDGDLIMIARKVMDTNQAGALRFILLYSHRDIKFNFINWRNVLVRLVKEGFKDIIQILFEWKSGTHFSPEDIRTAMNFANNSGKEEIYKFLRYELRKKKNLEFM